MRKAKLQQNLLLHINISTMKPIKLLLILLICPTFAFTQNWQWARSFGGLNDVSAGITNIDSNGNLFLLGNFGGQCYFQTDTLWTSGNAHGMFLAKLDNSGNEIWIKQPGGARLSGTQERLTKAVLDEVNSAIYLSGSYSGTLSMDGHSVTSFSTDHFLVKLDLNGVCQWIITAGSLIHDEYWNSDIVLDNQSNIYWTAEFLANGTLNFTSINKGSFLAKVNSSGIIQWARNEFVDIDPFLKFNGNRLYFTGTTRGDTCIVDTDTIFNNSNISIVNPVIGELDINGDLQWVNHFPCTSNGYSATLEFDNNDNLFFCGVFEDTIYINSQQYISTGHQDGFLIKISSLGNPVLVQQSFTSGGSNKSTSFLGLSKKADGNIYMTGNFNGITSIGPFNLSTINNEEVFVALIDENLNWLNVFHFGSAEGGNLKQDSNGDLFLSVRFQNSITLGSTTLNGTGNNDALIAKCSAITGLPGNGRVANNQLIIYANPNKGSFRIKLPDAITTLQNAFLIVYDQTGREVSRFALDNNNDSPRFEVNSASAGMYTVKLFQEEKVFVGRMVVE